MQPIFSVRLNFVIVIMKAMDFLKIEKVTMHHLDNYARSLFRDLLDGIVEGINKNIFNKYFPFSDQFMRLTELSLKPSALTARRENENDPKYPKLLSEKQSLNKEIGDIIRVIPPLIREKYELEKNSEELDRNVKGKRGA